jgi:hypothetical protein
VCSACSGHKYDAATDVYVVGWESNGTVQVATLWKNGSAFALSDGTMGAIATGVAVSGDDVYVSGGVDGGTGADVATYWKNGRSVSLTDGTIQAFGEDLAVAGTDVHVAGYEGNVAMLWKNGVPAPLTDGTTDANALAVAVVGGDVYVAGYEVEPISVAPKTFSWNAVAKIWKNGVPTALSDGRHDAVATSIAVVGPDVYAAGWETMDARLGPVLAARSWKNGVATALSDGVHGARATGVAVSGGAVLVSGAQNDLAVDVARVWRDGSPIELTSPDARGLEEQAFAEAIAAQGMHVVIAGYHGDAAVVWQDGASVRLTNGDQPADALAVAIVPHDVEVPRSETSAPAARIGIQPADMAVFEGQRALFEVRASGGSGLTYQWRRNGVAIPGATDSHFQTDPTCGGDDGAVYSVLVGNGDAGPVGSRSALLTVRAPLDLRFQWVGAPFAPRYRLATDILGGMEVTYSGTGSPLQVGGSGSSFYFVDFRVPGMFIDYRAGALSWLDPDWAAGIGPKTIVTSMDFDDAADTYALAFSETTQLGDFTPVLAGTVSLSDLQALASSEGSQGRVLTAVTFRGTGDVEYISQGWTLAGSTTYEAKVVASSLDTVSDDAASLAAEGYVITAFGSGDGNAFGVVMVGTRVSGDTAPRSLVVINGALSWPPAGFAVVGYLWDGTTFRLITEQ